MSTRTTEAGRPQPDRVRPTRGAAPVPGRPAGAGAPAATTAVLLTTASADGGDPAAALPWAGGTVVGRLLGQLAGLGVRHVHVVTRPEWAGAVEQATADAGVAVAVHPAASVPDDLRAVAAIARDTTGGVIVLPGDVVTHREALAGMLADPRLRTAALVSAGRAGRPFAPGARITRGRIVSAASAFHEVHRPNTASLGVLKVAPADVLVLAEVAEELAALAAPPLPASWEPGLRAKAGRWRVWFARRAVEERGGNRAEVPPSDPADPTTEATLPLEPAEEAAIRERLTAARQDAASLLLVGLVRRGVHVGPSYLRALFWARPLSRRAAADAERDIAGFDEDQVLLASAVKANDGFFTTFFVSPYSKHIARWAAHRGFTPNQVTSFSLLLGIAAAVLFALGTRAGWVAGAVLVHVSFVFDCVDGQLARYTRQFSKLGAWLDSVFDRAKEYVTFAGLAIGAERAGDPVWLLAGAALALQSVRHTLEFSFGATRHRLLAEVPQPPLADALDDAGRRARSAAGAPAAGVAAEPPRGVLPRALALWAAGNRVPGVVWVKKAIAFPIGERFAAIALTAAFAGPRTTFLVLLAWGGVAALYTTSGRAVRSLVR